MDLIERFYIMHFDYEMNVQPTRDMEQTHPANYCYIPLIALVAIGMWPYCAHFQLRT